MAAKRRGHPVRGAISGLLLGLFVAIDLSFFNVRPLDNLSVIGLPVVFAVLGIALGIWAPFGKGPRTAMPAAPPPPAPANVPSRPSPPAPEMGAEAEPED